MPRYTLRFKLEALTRLEESGRIGAVACELGVHRVQLYRWRRSFEAGGRDALRGAGRPRAGVSAAPEVPGPAGELAAARRRIAELERKVGQQHLELDFFERALRQVEGSSRASAAPGATASTPSSKR